MGSLAWYVYIIGAGGVKYKSQILSNIWVMFLVTIGWVIFKIEDIDILIPYLKCMFGIYRADWVKYQIAYYADSRSVCVLMIAILLSYNIKGMLLKILRNHMSDDLMQISQNAVSIVLLLLCLITLTNSTYNPFIYFKF